MRILNICVFAAANENEPMISYLKKNDFENLYKLESMLIFLSFL